MISFSAIVVALFLTQAVHSRGIVEESELCSGGEIKCDKSKCTKSLEICNKTTDCIDGPNETGCECCDWEGKCSIDKKTFCNTANITMHNMTLSDKNITLNMEKHESNMTMEDKNGNMTVDKNGSMTVEDKNDNMTIEDKNGNMTVDKNGNMTMGDKNLNKTAMNNNGSMTLRNENGSMTMNDKNNNMTLGDENGNMTMEDKNSNMTMEDKNSNMTMEDKNGNMIIEDKIGNMTMEDKNGNMTTEDKNGNMTMEDKNGNMTNDDVLVKDSDKFNMTTNEPVESKKNMTLKNAAITSIDNKTMDMLNTTINNVTTMEFKDKTMQEIYFNDGNSTEESWNSTEFDSTPNPDSLDVTTTENFNFTMEGEGMESNFSNETKTACNMSDSIVCDEFDPPCISAFAYCNDSVPCPSQNRSSVCGQDNLPLPKRKAKLANLVEHHEPEEKNLTNTNEIENDEYATKESLKVTESQNEGDNHLKIIIPVAVIGGLCLVAIIIWFITKRNKNVDSYALQ